MRTQLRFGLEVTAVCRAGGRIGDLFGVAAKRETDPPT